MHVGTDTTHSNKHATPREMCQLTWETMNVQSQRDAHKAARTHIPPTQKNRGNTSTRHRNLKDNNTHDTNIHTKKQTHGP